MAACVPPRATWYGNDMQWIVIGALCASVACKGDDGASKRSDPSTVTPPGDNKACKPMTGLCQRITADELSKLLNVPGTGIVPKEEDHDDPGPPGPLDDCKYTTPPGPDGGYPLDVLLRYQCLRGDRAAAADYKMTHDAIATLGQHIESVSLGDEAYWTYTGSDKSIIAAHMRVRKGNVIVQLNYNSYKLGDKQAAPTIAKERAIAVLTRMLAKLP
jgi:hypothetical protein